MTLYRYSQARQKFALLLDQTKKEGKVLIKRRDGIMFSLKPDKNKKSPLDIKATKTKATTKDIIESAYEPRSRG